MTQSFEVLLLLAVTGFYLYDSAMLLYANELVFIRAGSRWKYAYPDNSYQLLGKNLYFPNLLAPHNIIFRVHWTDSKNLTPRSEKIESLELFANALNQLGYMVLILFALFFLGLPFVLFLYGSGPQLLLLFLLIYIVICAMFVFIYMRKEVFELTNSKYCIFLFEALSCAPFALNSVRKLCLYRSLSGDPLEFAKRSFDQEGFDDMVDDICRRVGEKLKLMETDTNRCTSLNIYLSKLQKMRS